jgi:hypothetical protein
VPCALFSSSLRSHQLLVRDQCPRQRVLSMIPLMPNSPGRYLMTLIPLIEVNDSACEQNERLTVATKVV